MGWDPIPGKGERINTIAIDVRMMFSSGIGSYIRHLVPEVIRSLSGSRFYLLGRARELEQWNGFEQGPRVKWIEIKAPIFTVAEQLELASKIPKDADLFWSPHYNFPVFWGGKLFVTVHDVFHLAMADHIRGLHKRFYARWMFRRLVRRADAILCVSQFTQKELERLAGADPSKTRVVPNGLDASWFNIGKLARPRPKPYLLFVGNVKPHKNLKRLFQAFELLANRIPQDLVLVGKKEGFLTGDPEALQEAGKFKGRVQFAGLVGEEDLKQLYLHADLLVFPSLYEGFGFPPLEAMACGCPAVVSRAASLPEICGDAAEYFNPLDPEDMARKIQLVLEDQALRQQLIQKGLERSKLFPLENTARQTVEAIGQVVDSKGN